MEIEEVDDNVEVDDEQEEEAEETAEEEDEEDDDRATENKGTAMWESLVSVEEEEEEEDFDVSDCGCWAKKVVCFWKVFDFSDCMPPPLCEWFSLSESVSSKGEKWRLRRLWLVLSFLEVIFDGKLFFL